MKSPETNSNPLPPPPTWGMAWLPSITEWLWLLFLLILLTPAWQTKMVSSDGDACMHWRVGEWMIQNRAIVDHDTFSHTRAGAPIISKEWLSEVIFAESGNRRGLAGLVIIAALVIATTFSQLHANLVREGNSLLVASLVTIMAAWAASSHWLARPHVFTFLMILPWNDALRRYERGRRLQRLAIILAILTALWVNLHGAFLAGFFVLGAYWLGAGLERNWEKLRAYTFVGLICGLASLLNPAGYRLHIHNLHFLQSEYLTNWLGEYSSANFHSPESFGFLAWLGLIFVVLVLVRPRLSAVNGLLLISWGYFALFAGRNIPLLAILTAPILAEALSSKLPERWRSIGKTVYIHGGWSTFLIFLAGTALITRPSTTTMPADRWPVEAVKFIQANPEKFRGNMFNQYMWGGYLLEYLPEHKTFIDGRTDFYGEELVREFAKVTALAPDWQEPLTRYKVDWVLMPTDHRINLALAELPRQWSCIHSDTVAMIWRKTE